MARVNNVPVLHLDRVCAGYLETVILEEIDFVVRRGESVSLLGRNGVGKTTLLRTIMGQTSLKGGSVHFNDEDISKSPAWSRAHKGIGYVPQEREIFVSLTVHENLEVAALRTENGNAKWSHERVYSLFPRLQERRNNYGNQLSGGEQQMLAIGRALMGNPELLLMDEPFEGLAPVIIESLINAIARLKSEGDLAIVLVEQHAKVVLGMTDRTYVLDRGRVVHTAASQALLENLESLSQFMGIPNAAV